MRALVAGSGSIGRRHMKNLKLLGVEQIGAVDPDPERLQPMIDELGILPFGDYDQALTDFRPDCVLVCTPPVFHLEQTIKALRAGAHVFVEKPLANSLDGLNELLDVAKQSRKHVQIGYNMRYNPGLQVLRQLVQSGELGRVLWARAEIGQYLPDWRPWQDYRQSYTARKDLGGGIILDASHEIDTIMWMLGKPVDVHCMAGKTSDLEVDVEDCATLLLRFENGTQADIHLDFIQRKASRTCKLVFAEGTATWDGPANEVQVYRSSTGEWEHRPYTFDPNNAYIEEVRDFLEGCANPSTQSLCEGIDVLKVALLARERAGL